MPSSQEVERENPTGDSSAHAHHHATRQVPNTATAEGWREALSHEAQANAGLFFALALKIVRNRAIAKELCQQAFLKACEQVAVPPVVARTWLVTVLERLAWDWLRRDRLEKQVESGEVRSSLTMTSAPVLSGHPADRVESLLAAVARLPEEMRQAVTLRHLEGMTGKQAAEMMKCSISEVSKRLHAGLDQLREWLERQRDE